MAESVFFRDMALLMAVAGAVAALFSRLRWPKAIGYIFAGVLMNGHTFGGAMLAEQKSIETIAQLGVVFLMFSMGLSFSAKEMRRIRGVALPAALIDTVVMVWLGYVAGTRLFGWSPVQSLFLGVAVCDSATTLLAKVLDELGWSSRPFAKYVLGTSVCEDIVCVGAIAVATGFAQKGSLSAVAFAGSLGGLVLFFLSVIVFGFVFVPRLLVSVAKRADDEALLLTILGTCFLVSFLAYHLQFSLALGAFLVGIVGSTSDVRARLAALTNPLKSMFSAMFFVSIGLLVEPARLWENAGAILAVSCIVVLGKLFNTAFASLLAGLEVKTAVQVGFSMAQIGEFAFMVAILYAGISGDPGGSFFQIAVGASLLTTLANPWMLRLSDRAGDLAERLVPERIRVWMDAYRAWLGKIGAAEGSPAFRRLRTEAIRLGVYAALIAAVAAACSQLAGIDYSRRSAFLESHDEALFFILANFFVVAMLPLVLPVARSLGDAVSDLLCGEGGSRWQASVRPVVRNVARIAVVALYLVEWTMIVPMVAPKGGAYAFAGAFAVLVVGIVCWRFLAKGARRATQRFNEALTAEERREGFESMMTVTVPEGTVARIPVPESSPAVGGTVVSLNIRARTGASVVSVIRGGAATRNIGPEWTFRAGDTLVAMGSPAQIAALRRMVRGGK